MSLYSVQVAGTNGELQNLQVVPVQAAAGGQIMLQQAPQQVIQTADGQSLIYQPVQVRRSRLCYGIYTICKLLRFWLFFKGNMLRLMLISLEFR